MWESKLLFLLSPKTQSELAGTTIEFMSYLISSRTQGSDITILFLINLPFWTAILSPGIPTTLLIRAWFLSYPELTSASGGLNTTIEFLKTRVELDFASFKEDIWSH